MTFHIAGARMRLAVQPWSLVTVPLHLLGLTHEDVMVHVLRMVDSS